MPEPNRKLVDFMYEVAWSLIYEYRYGYSKDKVPAPWYDEADNGPMDTTTESVTADTQEGQ